MSDTPEKKVENLSYLLTIEIKVSLSKTLNQLIPEIADLPLFFGLVCKTSRACSFEWYFQ